MENTVEPAYWTEKLADAYLGYALPLYVGAPDVERWFSPDSMLRIDLDQPQRACDQVVAALESNLHEQRLPDILEARRRLLGQETIYDVVRRAVCSRPCEKAPLAAAEWVLPAPKGNLAKRLHRKLRKAYYKYTFRARVAA
jgi:hypothetical protein